jgi:hypothetical protein
MKETTMAAKKCKICKREEAIWACQPYGPDNGMTFTTLGSHYRGFYMLPLCDECKERIAAMTPATLLAAQYNGEIAR